MATDQGEDTFFGIILTSKTPEFIWNPFVKPQPPKAVDEVPLKMAIGGHHVSQWICAKPAGTQLVLRQFTLDHYAAEAEHHSVVVETYSDVHLSVPVKVQLVNLSKGVDTKRYPNERQVSTNIVFPRPPVIIRLDRGHGPVHIVGVQTYTKP